jgi:hypothetical protein
MFEYEPNFTYYFSSDFHAKLKFRSLALFSSIIYIRWTNYWTKFVFIQWFSKIVGLKVQRPNWAGAGNERIFIALGFHSINMLYVGKKQQVAKLICENSTMLWRKYFITKKTALVFDGKHCAQQKIEKKVLIVQSQLSFRAYALPKCRVVVSKHYTLH